MTQRLSTASSPPPQDPFAARHSHLTSDAFSSSRMAIPARLTSRRHPSSSRVRGWRSTMDLQGTEEAVQDSRYSVDLVKGVMVRGSVVKGGNLLPHLSTDTGQQACRDLREPVQA